MNARRGGEAREGKGKEGGGGRGGGRVEEDGVGWGGVGVINCIRVHVGCTCSCLEQHQTWAVCIQLAMQA